MNFWIDLWTFVFFAGLILFASLTVVVSIGGFFNIRSLFKRLRARDDGQDEGLRIKDDETREVRE
jgi:hypothetical protein